MSQHEDRDSKRRRGDLEDRNHRRDIVRDLSGRRDSSRDRPSPGRRDAYDGWDRRSRRDRGSSPDGRRGGREREYDRHDGHRTHGGRKYGAEGQREDRRAGDGRHSRERDDLLARDRDRRRDDTSRRDRRSRSPVHRGRKGSYEREQLPPPPPRPETRDCFKCGKPGHLARDCPDSTGACLLP